MILRNQGICKNCDDFIASIHRHDFRLCKCGESAVDGGTAYLRRMGDVDEKSIIIPEDLPYREAAVYLGVIVAMAETFGDCIDLDFFSTTAVRKALVKQQPKKPWFSAPKDNRETIKWLRRCVKWGLISEEEENGKLYWKSNVELAPWVEQR